VTVHNNTFYIEYSAMFLYQTLPIILQLNSK